MIREHMVQYGAMVGESKLFAEYNFIWVHFDHERKICHLSVEQTNGKTQEGRFDGKNKNEKTVEEHNIPHDVHGRRTRKFSIPTTLSLFEDGAPTTFKAQYMIIGGN